MSPGELMIRTIHWICACCGETARSARRPEGCATCGRPSGSFEEQREPALPSD